MATASESKQGLQQHVESEDGVSTEAWPVVSLSDALTYMAITFIVMFIHRSVYASNTGESYQRETARRWTYVWECVQLTQSTK